MAENLGTRLKTFFEAEMPLPTEFGDLATLYEAFRAAQETFLSFWNQPRGGRIETIDDLCTAMALQADRIADALRTLTPKTAGDLYYKAHILTTDSFDCGDDLPKILANFAGLCATELTPARKVG